MKPKVYLETSIISYLTANESTDIVIQAHQKTTRRWWDNKRALYDLYVSSAVTVEASKGNQEMAQKRSALLASLPLLDVDDDVEALAVKFLGGGALPSKARIDAVHIAVATLRGMDYLLTWNCKHIANAMIRRKIEKISESAGYELPVICTPDGLLGESDGLIEE